MEGCVAAVEPVFDKRENYAVFLVGRVKKSANVTLCTEISASKSNRFLAPPPRASELTEG